MEHLILTETDFFRLYRYCPWMRGMATSQISCNNGIDKETFVPLHHGKEK